MTVCAKGSQTRLKSHNDRHEKMYLSLMNMLKSACLTAVNSASLSCDNHTDDNSFISSEPSKMCNGLAASGVIPIGFCYNVPYNHYVTKQIAMVIEEDEDIKWIHFPEEAYEQLLHNIFGPNKMDDILRAIKRGEDYEEVS